jgi:hypothetical protein
VCEVFAFSPSALKPLHGDRVGFAHEECDFAIFPVTFQVSAINALYIPVAVAFTNHKKSTCTISTVEVTRVPEE